LRGWRAVGGWSVEGIGGGVAGAFEAAGETTLI